MITPTTDQEEYSLAVNNVLSEVCPEDGEYEYEIVITPTTLNTHTNYQRKGRDPENERHSEFQTILASTS